MNIIASDNDSTSPQAHAFHHLSMEGVTSTRAHGPEGFLRSRAVRALRDIANSSCLERTQETDCLLNQPSKVSSVLVSDWNSQGDQVDTSALMIDSLPYGCPSFGCSQSERGRIESIAYQPWGTYGNIKLNNKGLI